MIQFISGGARSGKSQYAECTARSIYKHSEPLGSLYYIATAKKSDREMEERITIHQQVRDTEWKTIEEPYDLSTILAKCEKDDVILIDCLTIWLSNVMFSRSYRMKEIEDDLNNWLTIAKEKAFHLIIVSNDVNEGMPHSDEVVQAYMYTLQRIHKKIVEKSDLAVQVVAGLPIYWKGEQK